MSEHLLSYTHTDGKPKQVSAAQPLPVASDKTLSTVDVTIAHDGSLSGASADLGSAGIARIIMPATWDAAVLTFQVSQDNSTWNNLYDANGTEYTVQAAASRSIILPPADFVGIRYIKVRSGTAGSAVTQTSAGDRIISLVTRSF